MATVSNPDELRAKLAELGERRKAAEEEDAELTREIKATLAEVANANGSVTKTEAADLLQMHRTTLYRVYGHG